MNVLETERLTLRRLVPEDAADMYRIYGDPQTMRFMGDPPASVAAERENIRAHIANHYERHGVGLWATLLRESGRLIGRCGLMRKQIDGAAEIEIAYLLERGHWGRGLATEAARAVLAYGFTRCACRRIVAVIHPLNTASLRVAEKIGMRYEREVTYGDFGRVALYARHDERLPTHD